MASPLRTTRSARNNPFVEEFTLISLGCAKNLVDSEIIVAGMKEAGFRQAPSLEKATLAILNTCAFIRPAREEALQEIKELLSWKKRRAGRQLLVCGCFPERSREELLRKFPEVDVWAGVHDLRDIPMLLKKSKNGNKLGPFRQSLPPLPAPPHRDISTPAHWAYLKISEGCDHACSFCVIPAIRGPLRSRPLEEILREGEALVERGAQEIVLIAQDTTDYGRDLSGRRMLPELLRKMARLPQLSWIRLLYAHPASLDEPLIGVLKEEVRILKYLDIPLQHSHPAILKKMGRGGGGREYLALLRRLRREIPDLTLRTTFIVGFPGEGEEEFRHLLDFLEEAEFDRVGAFPYSPEEGTKAAALPGRVHPATVRMRLRRLMEKQQSISLEHNRAFIGRCMDVLVEGSGQDISIGRSYRDAPEIDGLVLIEGKVPTGQIVPVRITDAMIYDLNGAVCSSTQ